MFIFFLLAINNTSGSTESILDLKDLLFQGFKLINFVGLAFLWLWRDLLLLDKLYVRLYLGDLVRD